MTRRQRIYSLLAAATVICSGMALTDQVVLSDPPPTPQFELASQDAAQDEGPLIGQRLEPESLHRIKRPGLYGISQSPDGSAYGVAEGRLIRFDPAELRVQSVIREVDRILD